MDRTIKPFNTLELLLVDRVKAYRASRPFIVRCAEIVQYTGETKDLGDKNVNVIPENR